MKDEDCDTGRPESDDGHLNSQDDLASLMESPAAQELTRDVERRFGECQLRPSRADRQSLATVWAVLLEQLPNDVSSDDVVFAITSSEFQGLDHKSWGLLLSNKFQFRFLAVIKRYCDERKRLQRSADGLFGRTVEKLKHEDPKVRMSAVQCLAEHFPHKRRVPLLLANVLVGKTRDRDCRVRYQVMSSFERFISFGVMPEELHAAMSRVVSRYLEDEDLATRELAVYLHGHFTKECACWTSQWRKLSAAS